jgi:hypothetical protein
LLVSLLAFLLLVATIPWPPAIAVVSAVDDVPADVLLALLLLLFMMLLLVPAGAGVLLLTPLLLLASLLLQRHCLAYVSDCGYM